MASPSKKRSRARSKAKRVRLEINLPFEAEDAAAIRRLERERLRGDSRASVMHGFAPPKYTLQVHDSSGISVD